MKVFRIFSLGPGRKLNVNTTFNSETKRQSFAEDKLRFKRECLARHEQVGRRATASTLYAILAGSTIQGDFNDQMFTLSELMYTVQYRRRIKSSLQYCILSSTTMSSQTLPLSFLLGFISTFSYFKVVIYSTFPQVVSRSKKELSQTMIKNAIQTIENMVNTICQWLLPPYFYHPNIFGT